MCNEECEPIKKCIFKYADPRFAIIPDSFDDYYKEVKTNARARYRKAKEAGFEVRKVDTPNSNDILDIYRSKDQRQGRDINFFYELPQGGKVDIRLGWPIQDYSVFDCDKHYFDFYGCFLKDKMVAFLELLHSNTLASVYMTMGHGDYLKQGIMKFLFMEAIRLNIGKIKYFHYVEFDYLDERVLFMEDLRIINHNQTEHLQGVSYYGNR